MINFLNFFKAPVNEGNQAPLPPTKFKELAHSNKNSKLPRVLPFKTEKLKTNLILTPEQYADLIRANRKKIENRKKATYQSIKADLVAFPTIAEASQNIPNNHLYSEDFTSIPREDMLNKRISKKLIITSISSLKNNQKKEQKVINKLDTIKEEANEIGSSVQKLSSPSNNKQISPKINPFTFGTPNTNKKSEKLPSIGSSKEFTFNNINVSDKAKSNNKVLVGNYTNPISNFTIYEKAEEIQQPLSKKPNVRFNYISPNNPRIMKPNDIGKHKIKVNYHYNLDHNKNSSEQYDNIKRKGIEVLSQGIHKK